jgi:hypothetical protein
MGASASWLWNSGTQCVSCTGGAAAPRGEPGGEPPGAPAASDAGAGPSSTPLTAQDGWRSACSASVTYARWLSANCVGMGAARG